MTALEFRSLLVVFVLVLLAHLVYKPSAAMAAASERMSWTTRLPAYKQRLFLAFQVVVFLGGLIGLIGMFFLARWAAIMFILAVVVMKFERPFPNSDAIDRALRFLVLVGEVLLVYLVFFGPARPLFR